MAQDLDKVLDSLLPKYINENPQKKDDELRVDTDVKVLRSYIYIFFSVRLQNV
tara:strand:+ start:605 stop:763 length:159 start_codon:yes stop_codon:yes gene_type:complete